MALDEEDLQLAGLQVLVEGELGELARIALGAAGERDVARKRIAGAEPFDDRRDVEGGDLRRVEIDELVRLQGSGVGAGATFRTQGDRWLAREPSVKVRAGGPRLFVLRVER